MTLKHHSSLVITWLLSLLIAYNSPSPSPSFQHSTNLDSPPKVKTTVDTTPISPPDESNLIRSKGYRWIGLIDNKYEIDVEVTKIDSSKGSLIITGAYSYLTSSSSIPIKGSISFNDHKIELEVSKDGTIDETFEGVISEDMTQIKGTWTKVKKNQQLPFHLYDIMNKNNTQLFLHALSEALEISDAEAPSADYVGIDANGIYIDNLHAWHVNHYFSPGNFTAISWYHSTARNSDYVTDVLLKKMVINKKYLVVISSHHSTEDYPEGKNSEVEPEIIEVTDYQVWMHLNGKPVNIFVKNKSEAKTPIYALLQGERLLLIDQELGKQQRISLHNANN